MVDYVVFPRGNRVDYTYDASLNLTEVRRRETTTPRRRLRPTSSTAGPYGVFGQRSKYTDPLGNITTYTLDGRGTRRRSCYPTVTSPASQSITETFTYDTPGRITSATDGAGRTVTFTYYTTGIQTGYLQIDHAGPDAGPGPHDDLRLRPVRQRHLRPGPAGEHHVDHGGRRGLRDGDPGALAASATGGASPTT